MQVSSNLEVAERLSEQLGNTLLLKREDMQPVSAGKTRPDVLSCLSVEDVHVYFHCA